MNQPLKQRKRGSKPLRVLIVDDCTTVRGRLAGLLADIPGLEVVAEAKDGKLALELIRRLEPDVVTLDLRMPEMGGLEVLGRLKQEGRRCRVMILAALIDDETGEQCVQLGATDVFDKVHGINQFLQVMRSL